MPYNKGIRKKRKLMSEYTLYEYDFNGKKVVSAIHWRDAFAFRQEHPEAKAIR
jgi:hypothetical protein